MGKSAWIVVWGQVIHWTGARLDSICFRLFSKLQLNHMSRGTYGFLEMLFLSKYESDHVTEHDSVWNCQTAVCKDEWRLQRHTAIGVIAISQFWCLCGKQTVAEFITQNCANARRVPTNCSHNENLAIAIDAVRQRAALHLWAENSIKMAVSWKYTFSKWQIIKRFCLQWTPIENVSLLSLLLTFLRAQLAYVTAATIFMEYSWQLRLNDRAILVLLDLSMTLH